MDRYRALVNGEEGARVPADDPGLNRGWSVFETLRTYGRVPFRLDAHLRRLDASAQAFGILMPPLQTLQEEVGRLCDDDVWIRITLTGANRVVLAEPIDQARVGYPLRVASVLMEPWPWLPGSVKHSSRAAWMMAVRHHGVDEVILLDRGRRMLEADRSNVFAVLQGELFTAPADGRILEGVTRGALIDAARQIGLTVVESPVAVDAPFEELYVSSTLKELAPVAELDGRRMSPEFGPVGLRLREAFAALRAREGWVPTST